MIIPHEKSLQDYCIVWMIGEPLNERVIHHSLCTWSLDENGYWVITHDNERIDRCNIFSIYNIARGLRIYCYTCCQNVNHSFASSSLSSGAPRRYKTLLHLINTSPRFPVQFPSIYSSVLANCRFMYASTETRNPLYSIPHLSFTMTGFPVSSFKNGLGFTGMVCKYAFHD